MKNPILGCMVAALLLSGCGGATKARPEPQIVTVEVAVPVVGACVPGSLGPAPDYPDTDEALRGAADAAERFLLIVAGRLLRIARNRELETVVQGCPKATR